MSTTLELYLDRVALALHRYEPARKGVASSPAPAAMASVPRSEDAWGEASTLPSKVPGRPPEAGSHGLHFYARSAQSRRWYFIDRVFPGLRTGLALPERARLEATVCALPSGTSPVWSENTRVVCVAVAELVEAGALQPAVLDKVHHAWRTFVAGQGLAVDEATLSDAGFGWEAPDPTWLQGEIRGVPSARLRELLRHLDVSAAATADTQAAGERNAREAGAAGGSGPARAAIDEATEREDAPSKKQDDVALRLNPSVRLAAYRHDVRADLQQGRLPEQPTFMAYLLCPRTARPRALLLTPARMAWFKALGASLTYEALQAETAMPATALLQALAAEWRCGLLVSGPRAESLDCAM